MAEAEPVAKGDPVGVQEENVEPLGSDGVGTTMTKEEIDKVEEQAKASKRRRSSRKDRRKSTSGKAMPSKAMIQATISTFYDNSSEDTCLVIELKKPGKIFDVSMLRLDSGGLSSFCEEVAKDEKKYYFGMVKVNTKDEAGSTRNRWIYIEVQSKVPIKLRSKCFGQKAKIRQWFGTKSLELKDLDDGWRDDIQTEDAIRNLGKQLVKAGGSHKPTLLDFGSGVILDMKTNSFKNKK